VHLLEKDIWVVGTLQVFRGYRHQVRHSRHHAGACRDSPEPLPPSRSQEKRWTREIRSRLSDWVRGMVLPLVEAALACSSSVPCDVTRPSTWPGLPFRRLPTAPCARSEPSGRRPRRFTSSARRASFAAANDFPVTGSIQIGFRCSAVSFNPSEDVTLEACCAQFRYPWIHQAGRRGGIRPHDRGAGRRTGSRRDSSSQRLSPFVRACKSRRHRCKAGLLKRGSYHLDVHCRAPLSVTSTRLPPALLAASAIPGAASLASAAWGTRAHR